MLGKREPTWGAGRSSRRGCSCSWAGPQSSHPHTPGRTVSHGLPGACDLFARSGGATEPEALCPTDVRIVFQPEASPQQRRAPSSIWSVQTGRPVAPLGRGPALCRSTGTVIHPQCRTEESALSYAHVLDLCLRSRWPLPTRTASQPHGSPNQCRATWSHSKSCRRGGGHGVLRLKLPLRTGRNDCRRGQHQHLAASLPAIRCTKRAARDGRMCSLLRSAPARRESLRPV